MDKKVVIIGASGHGRVVADIVKANNDILIGFLDDDNSKLCLGKIDDYVNYLDAFFVIAIGDSGLRREISNRLNCKWYQAIHPSAVISPSASLGDGTVVMPNAVINANSRVGCHCIINTSSVLEHDNNIGSYVHISVGAKVGGGVAVGDSSWIGIGATITNNITICADCVIGAGAVVVKDISSPGVYVGVPAKPLQ